MVYEGKTKSPKAKHTQIGVRPLDVAQSSTNQGSRESEAEETKSDSASQEKKIIPRLINKEYSELTNLTRMHTI